MRRIGSVLASRWTSNVGLAAINVYAFVDSGHDALVMAMGFAIGFIFTYDALRREP